MASNAEFQPDPLRRDRQVTFAPEVDERPIPATEATFEMHDNEPIEMLNDTPILVSDGAVPSERRLSLPIDPQADSVNSPPCYLPQVGDELPSIDHLEPMGPIGPWATGRVDWSPMAGLTGTRPVVDRYSITRFSPNEWRAKNQETINQVNKCFEDEMKNMYDSRTAEERISNLVTSKQTRTSNEMRKRCHLVGKWKTSLENSIRAMIEEISSMEDQRLRLKNSMLMLGIPASIARECIEKRTGRPDTELVRDGPEEELVKELALIAELHQLLEKTLRDFEQQLVENRTARQRLECDWSDKKDAYDIDTLNNSLNNNSKTLMFRPGAIRQPAQQSTEHYWEHFSKETLADCEACRAKSVTLRQTLNSILLNAARDLRSQADTVERSFGARIICTQENLQRFENELRTCLQKLADTENRIGKLRLCLRSFDAAMKLAQTRMDNRSYRPNVEDCRDAAQKVLIDEVHQLQSSVTAMLEQIEQSEEVKRQLTNLRGTLEKEIMQKRRTLWIDRQRCMLLRSHFPSANALSGN